MENQTKEPDRICTTKKAKEVISNIDKAEYFCLHDGMINRTELFAFAMAVGADTVPTKLENIYPGGLVLEKSIDTRTKALMYALFIKNLGDGDLDEITKKDAVYSMAQEYANTGFEIIEDYMNKKKDTDLIWDLLEEMDKQYESSVKS